MNEYGGYVPLRRGILAHFKNKRISPLEHMVYTVLLALADFETGIYKTSANEIALECGQTKTAINQALVRLRRKRYINYKAKNGSRESYDILIDKFEIRTGPHAGMRLSVWKCNGSAIPEYIKLEQTLSKRSANGRDDRKVIDLKELDDNEKHSANAQQTLSKPSGGINNKEEELKKERSKTPKSGGPSPTPLKVGLSQEIIRDFQLVDTPSLRQAIEAAIACAASRRSVDLAGGAEYLKCCARAARQRGARVNHLWFCDADGWEFRPDEKKSNVSERMSAQERRTANNIAVYREWCRQEGIDPDGQSGNFSAFNHAGRNARVQPKALLAQSVR